MGLDAYGITVLGVRVSESDFLKPAGTARCCEHDKSHENTDKAKFCQECGAKIVAKKLKKPRLPALLKDPENWDSWGDPKTGVGIHKITAVQVFDQEEDQWALGIQVGDTGSHRIADAQSVCALDYQKLEESRTTIAKVAHDLLGEDRPVELFTCVLLSY